MSQATRLALSDVLVLGSSAGRGRGLFARTALRRDDVVLAELPLSSVADADADAGAPAQAPGGGTCHHCWQPRLHCRCTFAQRSVGAVVQDARWQRAQGDLLAAGKRHSVLAAKLAIECAMWPDTLERLDVLRILGRPTFETGAPPAEWRADAAAAREAAAAAIDATGEELDAMARRAAEAEGGEGRMNGAAAALEALPDAEWLTDVVSACALNAFRPADAGAALFGVPSFFNHSCAPNVGVEWSGAQGRWRALRPVGPGEELFISYATHGDARSSRAGGEEAAAAPENPQAALEEHLAWGYGVDCRTTCSCGRYVALEGATGGTEEVSSRAAAQAAHAAHAAHAAEGARAAARPKVIVGRSKSYQKMMKKSARRAK